MGRGKETLLGRPGILPRGLRTLRKRITISPRDSPTREKKRDIMAKERNLSN